MTQPEPAPARLTIAALNETMRKVLEAQSRPQTLILSPTMYRAYDWHTRKTQPWPIDFDLLLFPRWTRFQRYLKRTVVRPLRRQRNRLRHAYYEWKHY